jgi:hypothetical protein
MADRVEPDAVERFTFDALELDPGDILEHGIILASYINGATDKRETGWCVVGEPSVDQTIGLMAIAQHRIDHHTTGGEA